MATVHSLSPIWIVDLTDDALSGNWLARSRVGGNRRGKASARGLISSNPFVAPAARSSQRPLSPLGPTPLIYRMLADLRGLRLIRARSRSGLPRSPSGPLYEWATIRSVHTASRLRRTAPGRRTLSVVFSMP
jgi:hypothetical protein